MAIRTATMPIMLDYPAFIYQLFKQALSLAIAHMGTTALALGAGWLLNVWEYRRLAMTERPKESWRRKWWNERKQGIKLSTGMWLMLFFYCLTQAAYQQYKTISGEKSTAERSLSALQDYAKHKEQYDKDLQWTQGEVKHWQDAYQREVKGETKPDRIMSREEEGTLYDALYKIAQDKKNKEFIELKLGAAGCEREPRQLAFQLYQVFQKAHWRVPFDSKWNKDEIEALNRSTYQGITIFYGDPKMDHNRANFLQIYLREAHLDSQIYPAPLPSLKGTIIWIGEK